MEHTIRVSHDVSYGLSKTITRLWGLWVSCVSPVRQVGNREVSLRRTQILENPPFHSQLLLTRNCPLRNFSLQWATVTAEIHNWSACCGVHECSALNRTYVSPTRRGTSQKRCGKQVITSWTSQLWLLTQSLSLVDIPAWVGERITGPTPSWRPIVIGGCWGRGCFSWLV